MPQSTTPVYFNMDCTLRNTVEKLRDKMGWSQRDLFERAVKLLVEAGPDEPCHLIIEANSKHPKVYTLPIDVGNYIRSIEDKNQKLLESIAEIKQEISTLKAKA